MTKKDDLFEEDEMEKKTIREIASTVFKSVTLAMGVAIVVLSKMESGSFYTLTGIGLACAGIALLTERK